MGELRTSIVSPRQKFDALKIEYNKFRNDEVSVHQFWDKKLRPYLQELTDNPSIKEAIGDNDLEILNRYFNTLAAHVRNYDLAKSDGNDDEATKWLKKVKETSQQELEKIENGVLDKLARTYKNLGKVTSRDQAPEAPAERIIFRDPTPKTIIFGLGTIYASIEGLKNVVTELCQNRDDLEKIRKDASDKKEKVEKLAESYQTLIINVKHFDVKLWQTILEEDEIVDSQIKKLLHSFGFIKDGIEDLESVYGDLNKKYLVLYELISEYMSGVISEYMTQSKHGEVAKNGNML